MVYLVYCSLIVVSWAYATAMIPSLEDLNSLSYTPKILEDKDTLMIPEWLQNIPVESMVKKYRKRRFLPSATTAKVKAKFSMPGNYILGFPSTIAFKPILSLTVPSGVYFGRGMAGGNRSFFFDEVENFFDGLDVNGRECLLRTICEIAEVPFGHGLIGEIINFLFGTSSPYAISDGALENENNIYTKAKETGEKAGGCEKAYYKCPLSISNFISSMHLVQEQ